MTKAELEVKAQEITRDMANGGADFQTCARSYNYVQNRIKEGLVRSEDDVRLVVAAFADGFCTGRGHRGAS